MASGDVRVWVAIYGSGDDGDECTIDAVFSSHEKAENYLRETYGREWQSDRHSIEMWPVN